MHVRVLRKTWLRCVLSHCMWRTRKKKVLAVYTDSSKLSKYIKNVRESKWQRVLLIYIHLVLFVDHLNCRNSRIQCHFAMLIFHVKICNNRNLRDADRKQQWLHYCHHCKKINCFKLYSREKLKLARAMACRWTKRRDVICIGNNISNQTNRINW